MMRLFQISLVLMSGLLAGCAFYRDPDIEGQSISVDSPTHCTVTATYQEGQLVFWPFTTFRGREFGRYRVSYDLDFPAHLATCRKIQVDRQGRIGDGPTPEEPTPPPPDPVKQAVFQMNVRTSGYPNAFITDVRTSPAGWSALVELEPGKVWQVINQTSNSTTVNLAQHGMSRFGYAELWLAEQGLVLFSSDDDLYCWRYTVGAASCDRITIHSNELFEVRFGSYKLRAKYKYLFAN